MLFETVNTAQDLAKLTIDEFMSMHDNANDGNQIAFNSSIYQILRHNEFRVNFEKIMIKHSFELHAIQQHIRDVSTFNVYTLGDNEQYNSNLVLDAVFGKLMPTSSLLCRLINQANGHINDNMTSKSPSWQNKIDALIMAASDFSKHAQMEAEYFINKGRSHMQYKNHEEFDCESAQQYIFQEAEHLIEKYDLDLTAKLNEIINK
jgi:hypothetical protein